MSPSTKGKLAIVIDADLRCAKCGEKDGLLFEGADDFLIPPGDLVSTTWGAVEAMVEAEIEGEGWAKTKDGWVCPTCAGEDSQKGKAP